MCPAAATPPAVATPPAAALLLLQVTNTPWGERVSFVFNPAGDVGPKALHVSPFMDMDNSW
jgi:DUF1365 family protein